MENLTIEAITESGTYPFISANSKQGIVEISGWYYGYKDQSEKHFLPLNQWISSFLKKPKPQLTLNLKLTYINTICQRLLFDYIKELQSEVSNKSGILTINWYYDADTKEHGEFFQSVLDMKFNLIPYKET
jgi:SiaC family regulatory phosphoprotein